MPPEVWGAIWNPTDGRGAAIPFADLPRAVVLAGADAAKGGFWIRGLDGVERRLMATAFP